MQTGDDDFRTVVLHDESHEHAPCAYQVNWITDQNKVSRRALRSILTMYGYVEDSKGLWTTGASAGEVI